MCQSRPTLQQTAALFDHLIGELLEMQRHVEAQRFGCLQVDHELELGGLIDRQVGRLFALEILPV